MHPSPVILPMEPEVTTAHTNLFLTRGCGIEELHCTRIFDGNLALLFTLQCSNRTTIYCICVNTDHFSFKQSKREPEICLAMLLTRPRTYLYQFKAVCKSRPETIFTRCFSFTPHTTGRKRVVDNAKRHSDLFWCADSHARTLMQLLAINNCTQIKENIMKQGDHNWEVTGVKELFLYTCIYHLKSGSQKI